MEYLGVPKAPAPLFRAFSQPLLQRLLRRDEAGLRKRAAQTHGPTGH